MTTCIAIDGLLKVLNCLRLAECQIYFYHPHATAAFPLVKENCLNADIPCTVSYKIK